MEEVNWEKRFDGMNDSRNNKEIFSCMSSGLKAFIRTEKDKSYQEGVAARSLQIKQWIQNIEKIDAHDDDDASVLEDSHVIKMARSSYDELITALTPQEV